MNTSPLNAASILAHSRWDKTHEAVRQQAKDFYESNKPTITGDVRLDKANANVLADLIHKQRFAVNYEKLDIRTIKNWIAKWQNEEHHND